MTIADTPLYHDLTDLLHAAGTADDPKDIRYYLSLAHTRLHQLLERV